LYAGGIWFPAFYIPAFDPDMGFAPRGVSSFLNAAAVCGFITNLEIAWGRCAHLRQFAYFIKEVCCVIMDMTLAIILIVVGVAVGIGAGFGFQQLCGRGQTFLVFGGEFVPDGKVICKIHTASPPFTSLVYWQNCHLSNVYY
jgi:hypothetical protein